MVFFTADTHFDHANIIRFCNRPFATVEDMNEALIANWNRKVHAMAPRILQYGSGGGDSISFMVIIP